MDVTKVNRCKPFTTQNHAGTLTPVTEAGGEFGAFLEERIRAAGLSNRETAERAGIHEATVRAYIRGYAERRGVRHPTPPSVRTLVKLSAAIGLLPEETEEAFRLAGLEMPRRLRTLDAPEYTANQLLDMLRIRLADLETAVHRNPQLPPGELAPAQFRPRGHTVARLDTLAHEARDAGDEVAAAAVEQLGELLNRQLVESVRAARSASEDQTPNH